MIGAGHEQRHNADPCPLNVRASVVYLGPLALFLILGPYLNAKAGLP